MKSVARKVDQDVYVTRVGTNVQCQFEKFADTQTGIFDDIDHCAIAEVGAGVRLHILTLHVNSTLDLDPLRLGDNPIG